MPQTLGVAPPPNSNAPETTGAQQGQAINPAWLLLFHPFVLAKTSQFWLWLVTVWSQIMIDWITAIIPCLHSESIYGGRVACITPDGEIEWQVEKKQQVPGTYETNLNVKSIGNTHLFVDGNPAKWLQGHNLFGSDDLIFLVEQAMRRLIPLLHLTPSVSDIQNWKNGNYPLKRIDCTAMWELPRRSDVRAWLRAAELQAKSRHGRPTMRGGTLYFGQHSKRWGLKFYSKGDELEAKAKGHKLPLEISNRDSLNKWADNKLRGELTLRSMQLKELGLDTASSWTPEKPLELLLSYIEGLSMAEQFSLTPQILDDLSLTGTHTKPAIHTPA